MDKALPRGQAPLCPARLPATFAHVPTSSQPMSPRRREDNCGEATQWHLGVEAPAPLWLAPTLSHWVEPVGASQPRMGQPMATQTRPGVANPLPPWPAALHTQQPTEPPAPAPAVHRVGAGSELRADPHHQSRLGPQALSVPLQGTLSALPKLDSGGSAPSALVPGHRGHRAANPPSPGSVPHCPLSLSPSCRV